MQANAVLERVVREVKLLASLVAAFRPAVWIKVSLTPLSNLTLPLREVLVSRGRQASLQTSMPQVNGKGGPSIAAPAQRPRWDWRPSTGLSEQPLLLATFPFATNSRRQATVLEAISNERRLCG